MKILFFVSSLNAGGAERVATTLANAWAQRGDDVLLVPSYMTKHSSFYPVGDQVRLTWLADCPGRWLSRCLPGLGKWLQMRRLVRAVQPDVVVSFLTNVNVNVLIATLGMAVPVIVSERTNPAHSQSAGALLRTLRRLVYRRASVVVMQTQASIEPLRQQVPGLRNVAVVANPLPPALPVAQQNTVSRSRQMVAMGRLVAIKQFDILIDAFGALAKQYPGWNLTIWGDGPLRASLEQQIDRLGLGDRVMLAGRTSEPWTVLTCADLFVMTSRVEGFPNVLLEAMALGLPCVALDCPNGPAELSCNGRNARLVPLDEPQMLIQALDNLMGDAQARHDLGRKAAQSVRQRYGLPEILAQWDELFTRARNH